jgi:hypothetical protein
MVSFRSAIFGHSPWLAAQTGKAITFQHQHKRLVVKKLRLILNALLAIAVAAGIAAGALELSQNASPALVHLAQDHRLLLQAFILLLILMTVSLLVGRQRD